MPKRKTKPLTVKKDLEKKKKQKVANAEKNQEKLDRDNELRREKRSNPDYLEAESSRDLISRQNRRSDLEYLQAELSRDSVSRQNRRSDVDYLEAESARDSVSRQNRRSDVEHFEAELSRDSVSRQNCRSDVEYLEVESARDLASLQKRRAKRIPWNKAIETYNAIVKDGPYHRCYSCDRLFFKTQVSVTTREKLQEKRGCTDAYITGLIISELIDDPEFIFCSTCMAHIRKQTYSKLNINQSNLKFPDVPDCLKKLTPLAERCVAARIPFMKIEQANYAGQLKIKSGIVNVPIDVSTAVNAIPRSVDDTHVIEVSLMRKMSYKNPYIRERVRPADVWAAAEYLCQTPLYTEFGITLNQEFNPAVSAVEPDNETVNTNNELQSRDTVNLESPSEPEPVEPTDRHLPEETLLDSMEAMQFVPELDPSDAIRIAPGEGRNPIPMFMDKYCEELAFPTIWCGQQRAMPPDGQKALSNLDYVNSEIRRYDRRACRPDHILYLYKKSQIEQLTKRATVILRKSTQNNNITAGQVANKQFLDNAVNNDSAYRFMAAITGSPPYFEAQKKKVMAMVRQFGGFTFFVTNSAAETHWPELLVILKKTVDKADISGEEAMDLTFEEKSRLISSDPVTCAQYFYHRLKALWKTWEAEDGPFGKYKIAHKYCRIEWQHRGSPHAHQFVDLKDAPKFNPDDPDSYKRVCEFIDEIFTTDTDDPEVSSIIYVQKHRCTHTCKKGRRGKETCRFNAPFLPLPQTMILEPIPDTMVLAQAKKDLLRKINENLHDILESEAASSLSFDDLLDKLGCSFDDYLLAARAKLKSRKVFVKRLPKNARINPYNKKMLIAMRSNMDIQFILDVYSCICYVVDYVNKADKGLSRLLRQCIKDYERGNHSIKSKLNALSKVLYNCSETSAQEAAWIRLRQPMCMSSDVVEFIHSGPKSQRQRMLKTNAEIDKLMKTDPNSTDIYKKGLIDRYSDRPEELENECLADFIAKYNYKPKGRPVNDNTEEGDIANDAEELEIVDDDEQTNPLEKKTFELKNNSGTITRRRRPKVIRYCRFNIAQDEANYYREMCLLFLPWRNEDTDIESQNCSELFHQNEATIKENYDKYNAVSLDLEQMSRDIQNERLLEEADAEDREDVEQANPDFQNVYDFDDTIVQPNAAVEMGMEAPESNTVVSRYKVPDILSDDEYYELCDSLNERQRDYLMHVISCFNNPSCLPINHYIAGGAGFGKSRLIKAIYQSIMRIYRSEPGPVDSNEVLLVAYTGMAAHNIGGITAHSAFHLAANQGKTDKGLPPDIANTLASNMRSNKLTIIDEISFLSSKHLHQMSSNMKQAFKSKEEFAGRSIIAVGDFAQLRPIGAPYCFQSKERHSTAALVDNPQWKPFQMFELTEIMRQRDDLRFAEALNRLAVGRTTQEDNQLFESRCFNENTLPTVARTRLRLIAFNEGVDTYNMQRAQELIRANALHFTYKAVDKFIGTYKDEQKRRARHLIKSMKPNDTQGLIYELQLVIGLRYMISTNIDVCDGLFNGACGILRFVELQNRKINAIYIEFDDVKTGAKARSTRHNVMQANAQIQPTWTPITVTNRCFNTTEGGKVQVSREQYPILMAEAITIHKSQGRSEEIVTVDVRKGMNRQKYYVAFSRATSLNGLHIIGQFNPPSQIEENDPVKIEMERLRQNPLIPKFQFLRIVPENVIQIVSHNVQSIRKHISSVVTDSVYTNSHILAFQESWAINNESYNIPDFEEISRNSLSGRPRAFGTINFFSVMGAIKRKNENKIKDLERKLIKSKNDAKLLEKCLMLEKVERNVKKQKVETDIESTTKTELSMKDDENFEMEISLEMLSQIDSLEKKLDKPVCDDNMNFGIKNDHNDENGPHKLIEPEID
ncbi:unnamed protein product [Chironomus riparius]|uniref:ATP-dependent DNA helicase n=1 Tax=Chironomus riparius TaxID=315576 RepID=A0A9N9WPL1_9DIPT|nr:unnamed protein product [Chironomus riparius]